MRVKPLYTTTRILNLRIFILSVRDFKDSVEMLAI